MAELLPGTAEEYREAVSFFKAVGKFAGNEREMAMAALAVDALRYAALRKENRRLSSVELKKCHGMIVYGYNPGLDKTSAGFVDVRQGGVVMLDHEGTWIDTWDIGDPYVFRFPPVGADIFPQKKNRRK